MCKDVQATGAAAYWDQSYYGQGVDVALIDTGVAPVPGLNNGNVVYGPDLSFESQSPYANIDTFGHGTHLAGIIAGRDSTVTEPLAVLPVRPLQVHGCRAAVTCGQPQGRRLDGRGRRHPSNRRD